MNVSKQTLTRTLRSIHTFDPAGSPFVGIGRRSDGITFHRTSPVGVIESIGYDHDQTPLIVSLSHLRDSLGVLDSEEISIDRDTSGICRISSVGGQFHSEIRVHTARPDVPWARAHQAGQVQSDLPVDLFEKVSISGFQLVCEPVLKQGKLLLSTAEGIVIRDRMPAVSGTYPRRHFIQAVGGSVATHMYMTDMGYWGAEVGGLHILMAGHHEGDAVFNLYKVADTPIAELPAARLLYAFRAASTLAEEGAWLSVDPRTGIQVRDQYGNPAVFSLGEGLKFTPFTMKVRRARVLCSALEQATEETLLLGSMDASTYRLTRGPWSVSFKISA